MPGWQQFPGPLTPFMLILAQVVYFSQYKFALSEGHFETGVD